MNIFFKSLNILLFIKYISNSCKSQIAYLYKRVDHRVFNNTNNVPKYINQYATDVVNTCEINKVSNLKKTCYSFIDDVVVNKHNTTYTNDDISVINNTLVNLNDNNYPQRK